VPRGAAWRNEERRIGMTINEVDEILDRISLCREPLHILLDHLLDVLDEWKVFPEGPRRDEFYRHIKLCRLVAREMARLQEDVASLCHKTEAQPFESKMVSVIEPEI
jgi:hypothetical protein